MLHTPRTGAMLHPAGREIATLSIAVSILIVIGACWWIDHERLRVENDALRRKLQSIEARLQDAYRERGANSR